MIHLHKPGIRVLGVSESFQKNRKIDRSILAGVVMRADRIIDGFAFGTATIGGMDATQTILEIFNKLHRNDINIIMLNGCIISWFNVIDLNKVYEETHLPLICVTYEESEGLEKYFKQYFPKDWKERIEVYHRNGVRRLVSLKTGCQVYVRHFGVTLKEAQKVINKFLHQGAIPEPLRVARLLAKAVYQQLIASEEAKKCLK